MAFLHFGDFLLVVANPFCFLRYLWQPCHATQQVPVACDESTLLIIKYFLIAGLLCVIAGSLYAKFKNKWENTAFLLVSVIAYLLISLFYLYLKTSV